MRPLCGWSRAFTLIEMIVVITIMGVLLSIALPQYRVALMQSREAALKEDLFRLRDAIDQYQVDKGKYPASLDALVSDGYLRSVPADPVRLASRSHKSGDLECRILAIAG